MASKTQKQENLERAIDAAKAYAERGGMVVLEPIPGGFHANDAGMDVYVTVAVGRVSSVPMSEPTAAERRRAARAGWRLDRIELRLLSEDRALLRHMRACAIE
jgi:hypothetical protein